MKTKEERLEAIKNAVRNHTVGNQEELLNILEKEGFNITQATLSRDIKALKIIKAHHTDGSYAYSLPEMNIYSNINQGSAFQDRLISYGLLSLDFSGNLGVIKTRPGYAMGIASDIDSRASHVVLGTIAGDDTILLIPREGISKSIISETIFSITNS